ncbi:MAG: HAD family hydrolase [Cyclobacteriaceae bacterium]
MNTSPFAVLFDMDGVLIDSNPYHKIALQQFCRKYGYDLSEDELRTRIYGRTNKDWITNLFGNISSDLLNRYADEKEALFREIYKNDISPLKGLIEFLDLLEANRIPKAIATSAPRANVNFTLHHTGIGKYFSTILDESFVSRGKPDPEIYIKTAAALSYPSEKCIVMEDSLSGIASGMGAGSKVVALATTHLPEELSHADLVIHDFSELNLSSLQRLMN